MFFSVRAPALLIFCACAGFSAFAQLHHVLSSDGDVFLTAPRGLEGYTFFPRMRTSFTVYAPAPRIFCVCATTPHDGNVFLSIAHVFYYTTTCHLEICTVLSLLVIKSFGTFCAHSHVFRRLRRLRHGFVLILRFNCVCTTPPCVFCRLTLFLFLLHGRFAPLILCVVLSLFTGPRFF